MYQNAMWVAVRFAVLKAVVDSHAFASRVDLRQPDIWPVAVS
jgi:hypothetical protein